MGTPKVSTDHAHGGHTQYLIVSDIVMQMVAIHSTVECRYNAVQFIAISHTTLLWQWQNVNKNLIPQQTPHTSPLRVSRGVSILRIWEKNRLRYNGIIQNTIVFII